MGVVDFNKILELQNKPERIRNICILAHVDHGKTTVADSLLASNGIISGKLAGKLRYMDSRKDEQERGITMKSSAITLLHYLDGSGYLINLIDSPGHVDFSSEVSTAVRLCDGAIVVVDVVEGVCAQTKVALRQAWLENIKPVLILNKMDRFILELKLSPLDAYFKLMQILEQVNAVMGELFAADVLSKSEEKPAESGCLPKNENKAGKEIYDWSSGLEEADDENLYFSPERENVIFASAYDGWAFDLKEFAKIYSEKLGVSEEILKKTLWGDFYVNSKTKRILKGAQAKAKKPLFVQFILDNIWALYDVIAVRKDKEKLDKIIGSLGIKLTTRDLRHTDYKVQLQAVCSQWLPLARTVLDTVCKQLPSPVELSSEKAECLMSSSGENFECLPPETQKLKEAFTKCSSSPDEPTIVFISKMFPVEKMNLPEFRQRPLTADELAQRREIARRRHEAKLAGVAPTEVDGPPEAETEADKEKHVFVAFARVFSGSLRQGQELFVLGPKHDPSTALKSLNPASIGLEKTLKDLKAGQHVTKVQIDNLYLLMGKDLQSLKQVSAGNIVGIGNLEEHVLKTATLSDTLACPSFTEIKKVVVPILRVAVEPSSPSDLQQLIKGLKLLNQADAAVQVLIQETGEHVIVTDGEVHLQRCLDDLRERYAKVPINVSEPIVPFRETVVPPPRVDMVNQAIDGQNTGQSKDAENGTTVRLTTPNKQCTMAIMAAPLPNEVTSLLESNADLIKIIDKSWMSKNYESFENAALDGGHIGDQSDDGAGDTSSRKHILSDKTLLKIDGFKKELKKALMNAGQEWEGLFDRIWCFGPKRCGPNVLFNLVENYSRSIWESRADPDGTFSEYDSSFSNGFQLATLAGPLCEEPMMGVAFFVKEWEILEEAPTSGVVYGPLSGQIMSCVKEGCRKAFQAQPQRLMAAMYSCTIQVNAEMLGKMYAVLGRRHGRVLHGDMTQGSASFSVTAVLPVVESFSFAPEIRKQTSGLAVPQLVFSHWESLQLRIDLWTTTTGHLLDRSFTRRFCHRKSENELYRSNSFRFEKFDKQDEDVGQQVSLCDDYSLPVDFVNKKLEGRGSRRREPRKHVDVAENYFDPKDSRHPHRSGESDKARARRKRHSNPVDTATLGRELRNSLRVSVPEDKDTLPPKPSDRRPSPYYYSDLLDQDDSGPSAFKSYQKPPPEPYYSQSSKAAGNERTTKGLESYRPFSAKENFEPRQGGLEFYDFASGRVRRKHRVVEVTRNSSSGRAKGRKDGAEEGEGSEEDSGAGAGGEAEKERKSDIRKKEYVKSVSLDVPSAEGESSLKKECRKSASLDIPIGDSGSGEVGESRNRFRPIVPVREAEEGIEGGDEEEEEVKRERKKSLKKLSQVYSYGYRDCLTGVPLKTLVSDEFSPAEILQHVIHSGGDSKSLLAACLAEWDAHARLMRPLTARTLTQCACAIGAQNQCISSDDEEDYHYSRGPLPEPKSQDSIRRRDFFKEPIPEGKDLGDEFIKGKKVSGEELKCAEGNGEKELNAGDIFRNWGIVVNEKGGFDNWNVGYDENSDSAEAYRIAREIIEETESWELECKGARQKVSCRSTESLYELDNMRRRGLLYETAFDCKISRSDDDLEELDRVSNHPVLHSRMGRSKSAAAAPLIESYSKPPRPGSAFSRGTSVKDYPRSQSKQSAESTHADGITRLVQNLAIVRTPTPPSTAPLPSKFSGHDDSTITSIKSAPELPTSPSRTRLKDTSLPIKSLRGKNPRPSSLRTDSAQPVDGHSLNRGDPGLILEIKGRPNLHPETKLRVPRPRSLIGDVRPGQRRNGRFKFSSTESMATSSSGGSLESIKSSTSEGNRSTSSSESHRSSSLSSHSSDSVGNVVTITTANLQFHLQQTNPSHHHAHTNKIHILSPISDKSSVEPASETSDNHKNNNSQKPSPEEHHHQTNGVQQHSQKPDARLKRRLLQNNNLINLALQTNSSSNEAQGSDSGISVESRTPRSAATSANQTETDFSDLPFDMPKLRRRRLEQDGTGNRRLPEADGCTSSSATSVDLRDLPFDMPKLRRKLRPVTLSESQASSSQSVAEQPGGVVFRPSMTLSLDLESSGIPERGLKLDLQRGRGYGTLTLGAFSGVDLIDPTLPLEKQTWYHGAITRVEAEGLLRTLKEGSYLVRNSESAKQDYSLSLKSAKGFMHMRIQMDDSGQFILGQFSKPFDSIPDMIRHYSVNRLPIRGAEHMCLLKPVAARLL